MRIIEEVVESKRNVELFIKKYLSNRDPAVADRFARETIRKWNGLTPIDIKGKDIFSFANYSEVTEFISDTKAKRSDVRAEARKDTDIKIVFENDKILVVHALSYEASCKYGAGTRWCVAMTSTRNHYDDYKGDGAIILFGIPRNQPSSSKFAMIWYLSDIIAGNTQMTEMYDSSDEYINPSSHQALQIFEKYDINRNSFDKYIQRVAYTTEKQNRQDKINRIHDPQSLRDYLVTTNDPLKDFPESIFNIIRENPGNSIAIEIAADLSYDIPNQDDILSDLINELFSPVLYKIEKQEPRYGTYAYHTDISACADNITGNLIHDIHQNYKYAKESSPLHDRSSYAQRYVHHISHILRLAHSIIPYATRLNGGSAEYFINRVALFLKLLNIEDNTVLKMLKHYDALSKQNLHIENFLDIRESISSLTHDPFLEDQYELLSPEEETLRGEILDRLNNIIHPIRRESFEEMEQVILEVKESKANIERLNKQYKLSGGSYARDLIRMWNGLGLHQQSGLDIFGFKHAEDLIEFMQDKKSRMAADQRVMRADKILQNDKITVVVPKTYEASCKYGAGTTWCTASRDTHEHWNDQIQKNHTLVYCIFPDHILRKFADHLTENEMKEVDKEYKDFLDAVEKIEKVVSKIERVDAANIPSMKQLLHHVLTTYGFEPDVGHTVPSLDSRIAYYNGDSVYVRRRGYPFSVTAIQEIQRAINNAEPSQYMHIIREHLFEPVNKIYANRDALYKEAITFYTNQARTAFHKIALDFSYNDKLDDIYTATDIDLIGTSRELGDWDEGRFPEDPLDPLYSDMVSEIIPDLLTLFEIAGAPLQPLINKIQHYLNSSSKSEAHDNTSEYEIMMKRVKSHPGTLTVEDIYLIINRPYDTLTTDFILNRGYIDPLISQEKTRGFLNILQFGYITNVLNDMYDNVQNIDAGIGHFSAARDCILDIQEASLDKKLSSDITRAILSRSVIIAKLYCDAIMSSNWSVLGALPIYALHNAMKRNVVTPSYIKLVVEFLQILQKAARQTIETSEGDMYTIQDSIKYIDMITELIRDLKLDGTFEILKEVDALEDLANEIIHQSSESVESTDSDLLLEVKESKTNIARFKKKYPEIANDAREWIQQWNELGDLVGSTDIFSFTSHAEFLEYIENLVNLKSSKHKEKDAIKVFENSNLTIILPKTYEASCKYGAGTKWCIASRDTLEHWMSYTRSNWVPLYVIFKPTAAVSEYVYSGDYLYPLKMSGGITVHQTPSQRLSVDKMIKSMSYIIDQRIDNIINLKKALVKLAGSQKTNTTTGHKIFLDRALHHFDYIVNETTQNLNINNEYIRKHFGFTSYNGTFYIYKDDLLEIIQAVTSMPYRMYKDSLISMVDLLITGGHYTHPVDIANLLLDEIDNYFGDEKTLWSLRAETIDKITKMLRDAMTKIYRKIALLYASDPADSTPEDTWIKLLHAYDAQDNRLELDAVGEVLTKLGINTADLHKLALKAIIKSKYSKDNEIDNLIETGGIDGLYDVVNGPLLSSLQPRHLQIMVDKPYNERTLYILQNITFKGPLGQYLYPKYVNRLISDLIDLSTVRVRRYSDVHFAYKAVVIFILSIIAPLFDAYDEDEDDGDEDMFYLALDDLAKPLYMALTDAMNNYIRRDDWTFITIQSIPFLIARFVSEKINREYVGTVPYLSSLIYMYKRHKGEHLPKDGPLAHKTIESLYEDYCEDAEYYLSERIERNEYIHAEEVSLLRELKSMIDHGNK